MTLLRHVTRRLSPARLGQIVGAVAAEPSYWNDVVRFDTGLRWYQRLDLADDYEIWLLTWMQGQSTGFHDHGDAAGAFAVVQGQVRERTVTGAQPLVTDRVVAAGGRRSFGPQYAHDVANVCAEPAITVHAYSPPLTDMRRYELTSSGLVHTATQSAEQDW
ncbi:MAG TPA: cysteine dioxygenase family protein [Streptosporangiaceae bacterium]|jgi:predicted metal-dependent enzyme (double-stranded beta helix superfamily)